jgi:hypothetical protein
MMAILDTTVVSVAQRTFIREFDTTQAVVGLFGGTVRGTTLPRPPTAKTLARRRALDIEAGCTVEDAQDTGRPNDHPDRVEARWRAIQGTLGVNQDALPREGRL